MASTFSGIIESFIKPEALAEFDTLGSKLDASLQGFDKMIAKAALLSTEITKGGQAYSQYIAQTKQIADANNQLQNSQGSITANLKSYNNLLKETADNIKQNTGATDDQARRLIALRTEYSKVKDAVALYQKLIREVGKENPAQLSDKTFTEVFNTFGTDTANGIKEAFNSLDNATKGDFIQKLTADAGSFLEIQKQLQFEIKAVASAIDAEAKAASVGEGGITQLGIRLDALKKSYSDLSEVDANSPVGQGLKKQIDELDPVVKRLEKGIGVTKRLVGDYADQLSPAFQTLNERLTENGKLLQDNAKFSQLSADAQQSLLAETAALEKLMKSNAVTVGDLKSQNVQLQKTLIGLEEANLKGSDSYKIIQAELVKGTKAVHDLRGEVKLLSSDTHGLDQAVGAATALVNIYQTGAGAMQLFGASTEDSQKQIAKLVAVQSVLNGLQGIQQQLTQRGTILNRIYAFAQAQIAIATDASAAATVRLRAALITTGIGALIVLVGFLISKMLEFSSSEDDAANSTEALNKSLERQSDFYNKLNDDIERNKNVRLAQLKSIGASETELSETEKKALLEKKKNFEEENKINIKKQDDLFKRQRLFRDVKDFEEKNAALQKSVTNNNKQIADIDAQLQIKTYDDKKHAFDKSQELSKKEMQAALDLLKFRKEQQIKEQQDISGNNLNSVSVRIAAREKEAELRNDIVVAEYNFAIKYGKLTTSGIVLQGEQRAAKEKDILENSLRDQLAIRQEFANKFKAADAGIDVAFFDQNSAEKQILELTAALERRRNIILRNSDEEITQLNNARAAGIVSEDQYNLKRVQIEEETALAILKADLDMAEKKMAILKKLGIDTVAVETEIARIRKEISDKQTASLQGTDNAKSGNSAIQDQINKTNELRDAWYNLGQTLSDSVFAVLTRGFEQAKNDLQDQIDLIDEQKAKEIEAVNATTASAQDKADRIKIIEATADAQKTQLEARQRKADQEKAKFERAAQIAAIIGNTAQGATAALTSKPPNVTLSRLIEAEGALQLLALLAVPLPKYLYGKKAGQGGGLATVSEDGRPELYIDPNTGTMGLTPAKPSLMYVSKASTIIPAGQVNDFLKYSGIGHVPQFAGNSSNSGGGSSFTDMNIVNAIKDKKMQQVVIINNNLGWAEYVKTMIFK